MLVVTEVTDPPFLDSHLENLYIEVNVVSQKSNAHKPSEVSIENLLRSSSSRKGRTSNLEIKRSKTKSSLIKIKE